MVTALARRRSSDSVQSPPSHPERLHAREHRNTPNDRSDRPGAETAFRVSDIQKLEVMSGRRRSVTKSLLIGTGAGVVLGSAIGAMTHEPCESTETLGCILEPENRSQSAALGGLGGALMGLVVGGVVGLVPRERWERVRLDGRVARLDTRMLPDAAQGLGLAVAF